MNSGKTLTTLAVCLSFWTAIVLLLLLSNGELSDSAIATPIATIIEKQETVAVSISTPDMISTSATEISPALHTIVEYFLSDSVPSLHYFYLLLPSHTI